MWAQHRRQRTLPATTLTAYEAIRALTRTARGARRRRRRSHGRGRRQQDDACESGERDRNSGFTAAGRRQFFAGRLATDLPQCAAAPPRPAVSDFGTLLKMQSGGRVHRTTLIRLLRIREFGPRAAPRPGQLEP